ncbi:hypothetical protein Sant_1970 [Sodalis praecaptivus]|uniref:EamA domain-containing protein n=1 Tax=Sodalis praecaptivus TaxID=1239307 RepID=W0HWZ6_9GAMM|nr:EamA family transporter [Sodalis praecaptivus]AHF77022.1 hypothetical protein Sant_1970 [Sodalis praecaptivus]
MAFRASSTSLLILSALLFQWLYNGLNYVAFKIGAGDVSPFLLSAMRFSLAAVVVFPPALAAIARLGWPPRRQIMFSAISGIIMLVFSQALVLWGVHLLPAGTSALFASSAPLFIVLISWGVDKVLPSGRQLTGVAVGCVGIALLTYSNQQDGQRNVAGIAAILISTASWAFGAVVLTRNVRSAKGIRGLFIQFFSASVVLWAAAALSGELKGFSLAKVSAGAWWSLCYLVLISSVCGYGVFIWLSLRTSPAVANSFFYVAPVVAMIAGAAVFDEPLTGMKMVAAAISLCGVILIVSANRL